MIYSLFAYPVSGVIKLWHVLLTALGADPISSWIASLFLLVMTVRLILLPFAYAQYKSTRIQVNLRPVINQIREEYKDKPGTAARKERIAKEQKARKDAGYRLSAGCLPVFIQLPFFLGLYRVLIHMARPKGGLGATQHQPIGFLTSQDVGQFLQAKAFGVPLPAYAAMASSRLHEMGTDKSTIYTLAVPLVLIASTFTTINMSYSTYRSYRQLEHDNPIAVRMQKIIISMAVMGSASPLLFGLTSPAPVAILFYWVGNNLWTMSQNILLYRTIDKRFPYTQEFREHYARTKAEHDKEKHAKKEKKRTLKRNKWRRRGSGLVRPWRIPALWLEGHREKKAYKQEKKQAKLDKKQEKREKRAADREADRQARQAAAAVAARANRPQIKAIGTGRHALKEPLETPELDEKRKKIIAAQTHGAMVPQQIAHTAKKPAKRRGPSYSGWGPHD